MRVFLSLVEHELHEFTRIIGTMALTNAELEFMAKVPAKLGAIEKQLTRIADALEKLTTTKSEDDV